MKNLGNKVIAILATNGFEESELVEPMRALEDEGATVHIISEKSGSIKAWNDGDWGKHYPVDKVLGKVTHEEYDALVIPGGVINPDKLRRNPKAVDFVKAFVDAKKPVAAICHGPWMLIEAGVVRGKKMTSFHSIKTDMINAGVNWVDQEVVLDNGIITSRSPEDLEAFNTKIIEVVSARAYQQSTP